MDDKIQDQEYKLHFRNAGVPFVVVELTFKEGGYGDFDYVVLYKGDLTEGYLSEKGLKQAREFGMQLWTNSDKIYERMIRFNERLKSFSFTNWQDLKNLFKEFGTLYRYCEQPMLSDIEKIFVLNCENPEETLKDTKNARMNEKGKKALDILNKFGKIKYDMHVLVEKPILALFDLIKDIPSNFTLTEKELDNILENNSKINIPTRDSLVIAEQKVQFNYDYWKEKVEKKEKEGILLGIGVSSGKVIGKVKKFISSIGFEEIPSGSVVVSGMTNPQLVPYLKNAVAIVTDEGGMTCHAAIVAREFGIPAVVGTEHATQILNDGDLVEVDADKGTIKKLLISNL